MPSLSPERSSDALNRLRIARDDRPKRSLLTRLGFWLCAFVLLLLAGGTFAVKSGWISQSRMTEMYEAAQAKQEVRITTVSVEIGRSADATVVATGYLQSRQQARIGARATGRIQEMNVEEGSQVSAGDILAVLEHADLDAGLAAMKASLARSKSELAEQDVEIQRTQREFERAEKSLASRVTTAAEFDTARFQKDAAVARHGSLVAAIALAEARVHEAEQLRENMFVRAPFSGTVISKDAELGESIMPGGMGEASGRGSVVTIADLEHMEVDCDVKEDFITRVKQDQPAVVVVDAIPDQRYKGRVRKVIPMGDRARATVKVRVEILNADARLFPEMSSTVYFLPVESESDAAEDSRRIFCLNDAIVATTDKPFVWIVSDEGRIAQRSIVCGVVRDDRVEITAGLVGGERLVVNPAPALRDNQLVKTAQ